MIAVTILAWPLKRLAVARLTSYADGSQVPPTGAELLISTAARPVQVAFSAPADPERICVYGMPTRTSFREVTAERPDVLAETALVGFRVRVFEPGEDEIGVDQTLGDMCQAVVVALTSVALAASVRVWLSAIGQDSTALSGGPEPSVTSAAALVFTAEAVAYA